MQYNNKQEINVKDVVFYHTEADNGGGVYINIESFNINIERSIFEGCIATNPSEGRGGAIYIGISKPYINSCCISNCSGYYCADLMTTSSSLVTILSTVTNKCHGHFHSYYIHSPEGSQSNDINISNTYIEGHDSNHYASGLNLNVYKDCSTKHYSIVNSSEKAATVSIDDTDNGTYTFDSFNIISNKVPIMLAIISRNSQKNNNCQFMNSIFYDNNFNSFVLLENPQNSVRFENCKFDFDLSVLGSYEQEKCITINSFDSFKIDQQSCIYLESFIKTIYKQNTKENNIVLSLLFIMFPLTK